MQAVKKNRNILYFFFLFIAAFFVVLKAQRGTSEVEEAGGIWNIIQLFYIGSGLFVLFLKENRYCAFKCVKIYLVFFLYVWFLSLYPLLCSSMTISQVFRFIVVPYGVMVLMTYYSLGIRSDIKQFSWILMTAFYIVAAILFFSMRSFRMLDGEQGMLADIYYLVTLLPLVLLYTPKSMKLIPFIIASVVTVMTGKRGAFVAMSIIMVIYFLLPYAGEKKHVNILGMLLRVVVFLIAFVVVALVINEFVEMYNLTIFRRLESMQNDGGGGRISRWSTILGMLNNDSNFWELLFGYGKGAAVQLIGGHVHNDFLEFFYDNGLFAAVMYFACFVSFFIEAIRMYRRKYPYAREFMSCFIVALCMAFFSFYAIDCTHITCSSICFGLLLADWYKYKNRNNVQYEQDQYA